MTHASRLTEISLQHFPELYQFYQHFPRKYPFLLSTTSEASSEFTQSSSYDILFIEPQDWLRLDYQKQLSCSFENLLGNDNDFLNALNRWFLSETSHSSSSGNTGLEHIPFTGGWFVFLAYEMAQQIEPCLNLPMTEKNLPLAYAARVNKALIFDHAQEKLYFFSEPGIDHIQAFNNLMADSQKIRAAKPINSDIKLWIDNLSEESDQSFLNSVETVKQYIKEGDVFQVNLSRVWQSDVVHSKTDDYFFSEKVTTLYKLLSSSNPAPFSGMASFISKNGEASIVSSSPERLLKIKNNLLESRPIAGTHPRGVSIEDDRRLINELHSHPKEQAEHIMLIDLIRNDLGRVCQAGTVEVNELMVNETYAHVHHIVSNVIGQLQSDKTPTDAIRALFPGGTITGCPKVRCMEIIAELEQQSRGAYTGSMGYINLDGSMDLNILIRTMVLDQFNNGPLLNQRLRFRAGAGLVHDSVAKNELHETRAKAKGLLNALRTS